MYANYLSLIIITGLILNLALFVCDIFTSSNSKKTIVKCIAKTINQILINFCTCPNSCRYGQAKNKALEESQEKKQFQTKCQGQNVTDIP